MSEDRKHRIVYVAKADDGTVIYVGQTINFKKRVSEHRFQSAWFVPGVFFVKDSEVQGPDAALARETELIEKYQPVNNCRGNTAYDSTLRVSKADKGDLGVTVAEATRILGWSTSKVRLVARMGQIRIIDRSGSGGRLVLSLNDVDRQRRALGGAA